MSNSDIRDSGEMEEQCFIKKGSDPPVCGVHEVALVQDNVPIDPFAHQLGLIACLKCPISGMVPNDKAKPK
jgi:hypothetical protein